MRDLPFALVRPSSPGEIPFPAEEDVVLLPATEFVPAEWSISEANYIAIDFETCGVKMWLPSFRVVGCALSISVLRDGELPDMSNTNLVYLHGDEEDIAKAVSATVTSMHPDTTLMAHNVQFDEGCLYILGSRYYLFNLLGRAGHRTVIDTCTYIWYRAFASEGFHGQEHGLKSAMTDVLGWPTSNEMHRDNWLISHGYHNGGPPLGEGELPEDHLIRCDQWVNENPEKRKVRPQPAEMWRCPVEILGPYAGRDAFASAAMYLYHLATQEVRFPEAAQILRERYMHLTALLIRQQVGGIRVDRDAMVKLLVKYQEEIKEMWGRVRVSESPVGQFVRMYRQYHVAALKSTEPVKYLKERLPKEPAKHRKNGTVSKSWLTWAERMAAYSGPGVSKVWIRWADRVEAAEMGEDERCEMSPTSGPDLRLLLYGWGEVGWPGLLTYREGREPDPTKGRPGTWIVTGRYGEVELERTDAGLLPVDDVAMSQVADPDILLIRDMAERTKVASYMTSYLEALCENDRLHPGWRMWGTWTGRLSGADPNMQQIPKVLELLDCFVSDDDCVWIESDLPAAEPHVLGELSGDQGLLDLYGPDAHPAHDRYLYSAAGFPGSDGDRVRAFYDRAAPDAEKIKAGKKLAKDVRDKAKPIVLALDYGAGPASIYLGMRSSGQNVTLKEVQLMVEAQKRTHKGVYESFIPYLQGEWSALGGFVIGAYGFPICVAEKKLKDLCNRVVQHGAHMYHVVALSLYADLLDEAGVEHHGIVWDFHDQLIIQIPEHRAQEGIDLCHLASDQAAKGWGGSVRMDMGPRVVRSLSEAKMGEAFDARSELAVRVSTKF